MYTVVETYQIGGVVDANGFAQLFSPISYESHTNSMNHANVSMRNKAEPHYSKSLVTIHYRNSPSI